MRSRVGIALGFAVCGLSVGWLVGLSVSPVVQITIEAILGVLVSASATVAGIKIQSKDSSNEHVDVVPKQEPGLVGNSFTVDVLPLAIFSLTLAVGSSFGVLARTNDLLGVRPAFIVKRWRGTGLDEPGLRRRLLDEFLAPSQEETSLGLAGTNVEGNGKKDAPTHPTVGGNQPIHKQYRDPVLFNLSEDDCAYIKSAENLADKKNRLRATLGDPQFTNFFQDCVGDRCVIRVEEALCKKLN